MVIGAVILSGGIIGLFGAPQSFSIFGTIIWVGSFFALATVGFTMVAIPYGATAGEMTQDPKERSSMMGFRIHCKPKYLSPSRLCLWVSHRLPV